MAVLLSHHNMSFTHHKRMRRSATAVMAGAFDPRPPRDVLTSLLNGVGPYKEVERDEEARQKRKQEKKEQRREEKKRQKALARTRKDQTAEAGLHAMADASVASTSALASVSLKVPAQPNKFWRPRPTIHIPAIQRSVSVTPSPTSPIPHHTSSPGSTPGPSISSSTSYTSSKRPRTPDDGESFADQAIRPIMSAPPPRKKRAAAKKGWKGWVEGSPEPSTKLINLDDVVILENRKTRSGRHFDGVGPGKPGWV